MCIQNCYRNNLMLINEDQLRYFSDIEQLIICVDLIQNSLYKIHANHTQARNIHNNPKAIMARNV